jgi:hypothetical protein
MRVAFLVLPLAIVSCIISCKEPQKDSPAPAPSPVAAHPAPSPAAASATASAAAGHSDTCEVEIFGKVTNIPKGKKAIVYVAQNDCLAEDAQILGHTEAGSDGAIVIEVFPKWGTDITICAGVDEGEGKPTTMYGKAKGDFHAEAEGEVTFNEVKIELQKGKPHVFPKDASDVPASKMPSGGK